MGKILVKRKKEIKKDSTDINLLVSSSTQEILEEFDKNRIVESLYEEIKLDQRIGKKIAQQVEDLLIKNEVKVVTSSLIRSLVDNILLELGYERKIKKQQVIGIPSYDLEQLIFSKTLENSNIAANNPEAVNFVIAETVLKQYALQRVFPKDVSEEHLKGSIHIHDIGFVTRCYCSAHSLIYLAKYGLELDNLFTASVPAKHSFTLIGHLNTFLSVFQSYFAGALGLGFLNVFFAPYLKGMSYEEIKQQVQYLWFSGSQNAFSRGGQSLFLDYGITYSIPEFFRETDAIGPGGKVVGKYKDFEREARLFTKAVIEIIREGDKYHRPFAFPKAMFSITEESFNDPEQRKLFEMTCEAAAINGTPYFILSRDEGVRLSQCCRLTFKVEDKSIFKRPEKIRFVGFQNITINLPQAAYRANGKLDKTIEEIEWAMELAMKAHVSKKNFIKELMSQPGYPLWQIGKIGPDGEPYVDLEKATYIIGMLGLNECVQRITGKSLHESEEAFKTGLNIIAAMFLKAKKLSEQYKMKVHLEESPAESASYRLAKVDLMNFEEAKNYVKGNLESGHVYYTNSCHLVADAPVSIFERIEKQAKFHPLLEAGAITHVFLGEQKPSPKAIESLIKKTFYNTKTTQITISPEFTFCKSCHQLSRGYSR